MAAESAPLTAVLPPAPTDGPQTARLDDVMLAMDVVDTLRHREDWLSREIDEAGREADLMGRLRKIYASQGIEVSDEVLAQGIRALNESRFVYTPPRPSVARTLALIWVQRNWYLKRIAAVLLLLAVLGGVYYQTNIRPIRDARAALEVAHSEASAAAAGQTGRERADRLLAEGAAALEERGPEAAAEPLASLRALRTDLQRQYELRVVDTAWKVPPNALHERIYFLIVEAVAQDGGVLTMPVANGEGGPVQDVARWGVQVDREVYRTIDSDLKQDGRIDDPVLGVKPLGEPDVAFRKPVLGPTITEW